jgi:hypothetical protein
MRAGEQLGQGGFDFIPEININAGGGVSFLLLHVARIKPKNGNAGEKNSRRETEIQLLRERLNLRVQDNNPNPKIETTTVLGSGTTWN